MQQNFKHWNTSTRVSFVVRNIYTRYSISFEVFCNNLSGISSVISVIRRFRSSMSRNRIVYTRSLTYLQKEKSMCVMPEDFCGYGIEGDDSSIINENASVKNSTARRNLLSWKLKRHVALFFMVAIFRLTQIKFFFWNVVMPSASLCASYLFIYIYFLRKPVLNFLSRKTKKNIHISICFVFSNINTMNNSGPPYTFLENIHQ